MFSNMKWSEINEQVNAIFQDLECIIDESEVLIRIFLLSSKTLCHLYQCKPESWMTSLIFWNNHDC